MNFLENFPPRNTLLELFRPDPDLRILQVNNHVHTPYSFSAFRSVEEAVQKAAKEGVKILGINDFYVTDGYGEFIEKCRQYQLFPLLNIELVGISREELEAGIRVNDPNNPGRTYISGKGLAFPSVLPPKQKQKLDRVVNESNKQVARMTELVNRWLEYQQTGIALSVDEIIREHAMDLLRERHVAKALREKIEQQSGSDEEFYKNLEQVYGGNPTLKKRDDGAGIEDELRARLLKAGAPAFVPEDDKAFMSLADMITLIEEAGGIPTYPMLLDGAAGGITEFESSRERLLQVLKSWGFRSVEMIPLRNRLEVLREYAEYFYENGFVVSFGTEHNTTAMLPLTVSCMNEVPLGEQLMQISFRGAAYLVAHQYLFAKEGPGYRNTGREQMEHLGRAVLDYYFKSTAL